MLLFIKVSLEKLFFFYWEKKYFMLIELIEFLIVNFGLVSVLFGIWRYVVFGVVGNGVLIGVD